MRNKSAKFGAKGLPATHYVLVNDQDDNIGRHAPAADRYGIPATYFGRVDDDFYGLVGRIVMLASLVELQLFYLLCTLYAMPQAQERYAGKPAKQMIDSCRKLLANEPDVHDAGDGLLDRVQSALESRHNIVHSSWPNPTLERAYRWRPAPKQLRSDDGQWIAEVTTKEGKLLELISELVQLVDTLPKYRQHVENQRQRRSAGAS